MARERRTGDRERGGVRSRRRSLRVAVPVAVVAVGGLTAGLVPALAASGGPDLPSVTAKQLLAKVAGAKTQTLSGTVAAHVDLGLPGLPGGGGKTDGDGKAGGGGKGAAPTGPGGGLAGLAGLAGGDHTARVAVDGPERQSVAVDGAGGYRLVHDGADAWVYDGASRTARHVTGGGKARTPASGAETPQAAAEKIVKLVGPSTDLSVDGTATVAGRDAYRLLLKPKSDASTVEGVRIYVDAKTSTPLRVTVDPRSGGGSAVDVAFRSVSFARPPASRFHFTAPHGVKVETVQGGTERHAPRAGKHPATNAASHVKAFGSGWSTVLRVAGPAQALKGGLGKEGAEGKGGHGDVQGLLNTLGSRVDGDFGSGTVIRSRLVNALVTEDGKVYAGAVASGELVKAADADR